VNGAPHEPAITFDIAAGRRVMKAALIILAGILLLCAAV
jgi:hypothetical protein